MNARTWIAIGSACFVFPAAAQQNLETAYRTTGQAVTAAFEAQRLVLQTSSAIILNGRKEIACGIVISPDGYILTKASEIAGVSSLGVTVDRQKYGAANVLVTDPAWDVALLKVDATGLVPVAFASTSDIPQGTWVAANGATTRTARRLLPGIISAKPREIPPAGGVALGVSFVAKAKTLELSGATQHGGASDAGLKKGDVILAIDGKKVATVKDIGEVLKDQKAGAMVKVTYRRGTETTTVDVRLSAKGELFEEMMSRNDQMSGDFSHRRSGFPRVIQHDILGSRSVVGGPLLDLDGRCVGMNIARANRAESFAIPVEELKEIAGRLLKAVP